MQEMITLVFALALQASWPADRVDNGWTRRNLTTDGSTLLFTKPGPRTGMIWTRQELRNVEPTFQTLSVVTLVELDCVGRRSRNVQGTDFTGKNLSGTSTTWDGTSWRYPLPGTMAEAILDFGCGAD